MFQHTAARRRLDVEQNVANCMGVVSTHSRPKAAGCDAIGNGRHGCGFNTQPPEGGWKPSLQPLY